jgi:hypothetical protein
MTKAFSSSRPSFEGRAWTRHWVAGASLLVLGLAGGSAHAACAYPVDGGCAAAPAAASFIRPNFYSYATSAAAAGSGQKWAKGAHPWNWNAAGVDYPVGYQTGRPLQDVFTAPSAGNGSWGVLPAACSFVRAGTQVGVPYAQIYCGRSSTGDLYIEGLNFQSSYLGGDCVVLHFSNAITGGNTIHIHNNNFHNGRNCNIVTNNFMVKVDGGTDNVQFTNNQVDGNYPAYSNVLNNAAMVFMNNSGNVTFQYNAFINAPQRPVATSTPGEVRFQYNYFETIAQYAGFEHGEIDENVHTGAQNGNFYSYNTILLPNWQQETVNAPVYCSGGFTVAASYSYNCIVDHNIFVTNQHGGGPTAGTASLQIAYMQYINVSFTNNYIDQTGAFLCTSNPSGTAQEVVGSMANGVMTITSLAPNSLIIHGVDSANQTMSLTFTPVGASRPVVVPILGSLAGANGGPGKYSVASQMAASFTTAAMSASPVWGAFAWNGNFNLVDGAAIPFTTWTARCP